MATYIEVRAAYGRVYKSQPAIKADWKAGLDFRDALSGSYVNKADADSQGLKVLVRYNDDRSVVAVN